MPHDDSQPRVCWFAKRGLFSAWGQGVLGQGAENTTSDPVLAELSSGGDSLGKLFPTGESRWP